MNEAGPSTPNLYLLPPRPIQPPPRLASTDDLLTRFRLLPAYDKYVRDEAHQHSDQQDNGKGKGREQPPSPTPQTPGGPDHDPDDDDAAQAKGEKKKKNSYKHLIKGVPGKHSMKKDDFLAGIMQAPPKQHIKISQFDLKTQREAFSVSLDGLKGWNPSALIQESAQAREDRKRRKELKRLAKAHAQAAAQAAATGSPAAVPVVGTPRPTIGQQASRLRHPVRLLSQHHPPAHRSRLSRSPRMHPTQVAQPPTSAVTPHPLSANPISALPDRGLKREREREPEVLLTNGHAHAHGLPNGLYTVQATPQSQQPGVVAAAAAAALAASKAGIPGARPRPLKKQKTDHNPMMGAAVHQQPTPQGV
ncbi:hypothetical protein HMN09_00413900 [Mycena chlorophos]|uniref:Mediator of RNA polymerase II transcription subunit 19 n=1 Tax=Mycena chlorophos TaxID=658473 RepID=A0A8H6TFK9_MYCCL|nr:hypothetical protein HMN09_00413900 [Mycena chlorophos]